MNFKLILITAPEMREGETEVITALFEKGLQILHLRKPGSSLYEMRLLLNSIPKKFHRRIVIHSHYRLANECNLKGIHLTEKTRKKKLPPSFNKRKHTLSASFHAIIEIRKAKRKYNYLFLSPTYNSISKKGYKSHLKEEELQQLLREKKNVIALGGITPGVISNIRNLGFAGAASLGYIWESKDPLRSYKELVLKIK
jgi:thiamine-phosphate pyrophosphorylase